MLRAFRWLTRCATLLALYAGCGLAAPCFAQGPNLVARITEPFQVGDKTVTPGMLSVKPVSGYHPGGTIDELWLGTEFLGLFVADGTSSDVPAQHDAFLFERDAEGRLALVGYVVHGSNSDMAYRYRPVPAAAALKVALPGASQHDRGLATR